MQKPPVRPRRTNDRDWYIQDGRRVCPVSNSFIAFVSIADASTCERLTSMRAFVSVGQLFVRTSYVVVHGIAVYHLFKRQHRYLSLTTSFTKYITTVYFSLSSKLAADGINNTAK